MINSGLYSPELWAQICADTVNNSVLGVLYAANMDDEQAKTAFYDSLYALYGPCYREPLRGYIGELVADPERIRAETMENIQQITNNDYLEFLQAQGLPDEHKNFVVFTNCINYAQGRVYRFPDSYGFKDRTYWDELAEDLRKVRNDKYKELRPEWEPKAEPAEVEKLPPLPKPRKSIISHTPFDFIMTNPEIVAEVLADTIEAETKNEHNRKELERARKDKNDPLYIPPGYKEHYGGSFQALKADKKNDLPAVNTNYSLMLPDNVPGLDRLTGFQLAVLSLGIFSLLNDLELEEKDRARKEKREPRALQDIPREELPLKFYAKDLYERFTGITRKWSVDGSTFPEMLRALDVLAGTRLLIDCTEEMKRRGKKFAPGHGELCKNYLLPLKIFIPYSKRRTYDLYTVIELTEIPDLYIYMKNCGYYETISPAAFRISGSRNTTDQIAINFFVRQQLAMMKIKGGYMKTGGYILFNKILQITETKPPADPEQRRNWKEDRKKDVEKVLCSLIKHGELLAFTAEDLEEEQKDSKTRLKLGRGGCCIWTFKGKARHSLKVKVPEIEARKQNAKQE